MFKSAPPASPGSAQALLAALADDPTERGLSELSDHYVTLLETLPGDLDHVGLIVVSVADGLLILPVTHITTGDGWEHLDLDAARRVPAPKDWPRRTTAFRRAEHTLLNLLTKAVWAAEETAAPS
jgi:hypothetical protein